MVDRSNKTVESWLYESNNAPEVGDLYQIYLCLKRGRYKIPKSLEQINTRFATHAEKWLRVTGRRMERPVMKRKGKLYVYRGENLELTEIANRVGLKYVVLWQRVYKADLLPGSDITALADRVFEKKYYYDGQILTTNGIVKKSKRSPTKVQNLLRTIESGSDVTTEVNALPVKKVIKKRKKHDKK